MKLLLSTFAACTLAFSTLAFADHHEKQEADETVEHYEAPKPATEAEALTLLDNTLTEIGKILETKPLKEADFETVHEKSYALRNATEKLGESVPANKKEQFKTLKDEVEEVHEEAEEHNEAELREHYTALQAAVKAYEAK